MSKFIIHVRILLRKAGRIIVGLPTLLEQALCECRSEWLIRDTMPNGARKYRCMKCLKLHGGIEELINPPRRAHTVR